MSGSPAPPPGMSWTSEWDTDYGDRIYGSDPTAVGNTAVLLTDLTPTQARELAHLLTTLADHAEMPDGLACRQPNSPR